MWKLRYTRRANTALRSIARYIADTSGSRETANRFVSHLRDRCKHLANLQPMMGRSRPELAEGLRSVVEDGYIIFVRYIDDTLEVVTIVEGHRHLEALFDEGDNPKQ